jgi:hypothetical protein
VKHTLFREENLPVLQQRKLHGNEPFRDKETNIYNVAYCMNCLILVQYSVQKGGKFESTQYKKCLNTRVI